MRNSRVWLVIAALVGATLLALAQQAPSPEEEVARQKKLILEQSGILPGELFAAQGEDIFKKKRGPNNVSLEGCDFGLGAGKTEGAYAELPRYFADTNRVEDLDTRIVTCMVSLQGFKAADIKRSDVVAIAAYVASRSNGRPVKVRLDDVKEVAVYAMGKQLWYTRAGAQDFSCAVCHETNGGKRIRLQRLALVQADKVASHWPAYRFSNDQLWTMEDRIRGCYKQTRVTEPNYYSDAIIALSLYMSVAANGADVDAPGFVR